MKILEIKPLIASQVKEVVALDQVCLDGLWTPEGYLRELDSPNSSLLTLSLADTTSDSFFPKIIGFACLWSIVEEAHITLLAIHPDFRRQGLGQLLLLTLLQDAIARKLEWVTLEVNRNNSNAISLYKKFGFQVIGTRKGYYQKTGEDASILWLKDIQKPNFQVNLSRWQQNTDKSLLSQYYYLK